MGPELPWNQPWETLGRRMVTDVTCLTGPPIAGGRASALLLNFWQGLQARISLEPVLSAFRNGVASVIPQHGPS